MDIWSTTKLTTIVVDPMGGGRWDDSAPVSLKRLPMRLVRVMKALSERLFERGKIKVGMVVAVGVIAKEFFQIALAINDFKSHAHASCLPSFVILQREASPVFVSLEIEYRNLTRTERDCGCNSTTFGERE